jgi:signal transduction histidine kinase
MAVILSEAKDPRLVCSTRDADSSAAPQNDMRKLNVLNMSVSHNTSPRLSSWRPWAGLAFVLAVIVQSVRNTDSVSRLPLVGLLTLGISLGWLLLYTRWQEPGTWLLGAASAALMLVMPGTGPVIGIAAAMVSAGLRLEVRRGAVAAVTLGVAFLVAAGLASGWSNLLQSVAFPALGLVFAYTASASVRRIRRERERAESLLAELQGTRAAEIERAALAERARIAREIHDVLAHTLSALAVQLEGTRLLLEQRPGDPAAVVAVERAHRLASEGLAEARRAIGALRGDRLPGPDGLRRLVDEFTQASGTPSTFEETGEPIPLASEAQLALYRTAQEALTNVQKHARDATSVAVCLQYSPAGTELIVEDVAPVVSHANGLASGYGLVGMRERAELVGGTLEAGPMPTGFRVRLWLPAA